jgi:hypothetical protein
MMVGSPLLLALMLSGIAQATPVLRGESPRLHPYKIRVRLPHGGEQKLLVHATSRRNAEAAAAAQAGGTRLGGRQVPRR